MVLNGLGFVNQRRHDFPKFFEDKPVDRLIGKGICASDLNEHVMVWSLDDIYEIDVTRLYSQISVNATQVLGLKCQIGHLDSTGFHTDGIYETAQNEKAGKVDPDLTVSTNNQNVGNQGNRFGSNDRMMKVLLSLKLRKK